MKFEDLSFDAQKNAIHNYRRRTNGFPSRDFNYTEGDLIGSMSDIQIGNRLQDRLFEFNKSGDFIDEQH
jgi:hypothetical protein